MQGLASMSALHLPGRAADDVVHAAFIESMPSRLGILNALRHAANLSKTPAKASSGKPLGSPPARWPLRS